MSIDRIIVVVTALLVGACSSETPAPPSAERTVGKGCADDAECAALPAGYCSAGGYCARVCTAHSDCGCPSATAACGAACVKVTTLTAYCIRTCSKNADCEIGTCQAVAALPYKVCG